MHRHKHTFPERPAWWPENEAWPPVGNYMRRNHFFKRMGCMFSFVTVLGLLMLSGTILWAAGLSGFIDLNILGALKIWVIILGFGLQLFFAAALVMSFLLLRRVFNPLDDLLEAAEKISRGDLTGHIPERGSPEMRSLVRAFNQMTKRLQKDDERRRSLMADVSHELRTPLTVLRGNIEGMLDGLYPANESSLRNLLVETEIISRLIDDLRLLSLAESGSLQLKKEPVNLLMLIREVVSTFGSQAESLQVELIIDCGDLESDSTSREPSLVEIDPVRMRQVINNLLSNALRYSPAGSQVLIKLKKENDQIMIEVIDEGPGIPPEYLPHIFDRYYKSADSTGMGLGLSIANMLMTAHGGQIEAFSTPGSGTIFRLTLPARN